MADNSGLGAGAAIAQGLAQGFQQYQQTQNMLKEQAVKERLANAQGLDAYTKYLNLTGTDLAQDPQQRVNMQNLGLITPTQSQGFLPDSSAPAAVSSNPPTGQQGIAPAGGSHLDSANPIATMQRDGMKMPELQRQLYYKQMDPQYQASLQNTQNQRPDEAVKDYNKEPIIQQSQETNRAYATMDNIMKQGNAGKIPGNDLALMKSYLQVLNDGKLPRGSEIEAVKEQDPALYNRWKNAIGRAQTNSLTDDERKNLMTGASSKMVGSNQEVKQIQSQYNQDPRNTTKKNFSNGNPFAAIAQKNLEKYNQQQPDNLSTMADNTMSSIGNALAGGSGPPSGGGTGPHGNVVKQNGHSYTWNPSTKKYEAK